MSDGMIKPMLGLLVLLLLVLFVEWQFIGGSEPRLVKSSSLEKKTPNQEIRLPVLALKKQSLDDYDEMVERPLFIKGRKPVSENKVEKTHEVKTEYSPIDKINLVGLYSVKDRKVALFSKQAKDKHYPKRSEGEDIFGWQLKKILPDRVILERDGKEERLKLRKPKPKTTQSTNIVKPKPSTKQPVNPFTQHLKKTKS